MLKPLILAALLVATGAQADTEESAWQCDRHAIIFDGGRMQDDVALSFDGYPARIMLINMAKDKQSMVMFFERGEKQYQLTVGISDIELATYDTNGKITGTESCKTVADYIMKAPHNRRTF